MCIKTFIVVAMVTITNHRPSYPSARPFFFFFFLFVLSAVPQPFLVADGFRLCRLDGTMTNKQRQAELKRFSGKGVNVGEGAEVGA